MIQLHDDNPTTIKPVVTIGAIVVCALVFLWQIGLPDDDAVRVVFAYGLVPAVLFGTQSLPPSIASIPAELSIVTSMFLHGGWMHLIGNMLYLWIFGNNIEDAMGHARFVVFYLLCGTAAALTQALLDPGSVVPMIGASGAIGGVLGGYVMLYPRARVLVLIPLGFLLHTMRVPALVVLGLWFVLQFVQSALSAGQVGGVAYGAHIGGFIAGALLIIVFRHKGHPLFGATYTARRPSQRTRRRGPWG